jgi:protein SCO1
MLANASGVIALCLAAGLGSGLVGCGRPRAAEAIEPEEPPRYAMRGQIVRVEAARRVLLVDHEEIPGYMPPMVMEFIVTAGDIAGAREGATIRGEIYQDEMGDFRLEKLWPVDAVADGQVAAAASTLRQDTNIRGRKAYREIGENLPEFALYDQDARVVAATRFRGQRILLNFIYTRCPIATMCPAAVANMMAVQREAAAAGVTDLQLVSITLEPAYDTPGVLRDFADARGIDTSNYSFLTGPETAIRDLLTQFGVIAEVDGPLIQHSMATLLIDANGRIIHRVDGSRWDVNTFLPRILPRTSTPTS